VEPAIIEHTEASTDSKVDLAFNQILLAQKEGREVGAVYEHQLQTLGDEEVNELNLRMLEEGPKHGIQILNAEPEPTADASQESAQEELPLHPDAPLSPAPEEAAVERPTQTTEKPEWKKLKIRYRPSAGSIGRHQYWPTNDGAIYINNAGPIPRRIVHGGPVEYRDEATGEVKVAYWNKDTRSFSVEDPTPAVREQRINDNKEYLRGALKTLALESARSEEMGARIEALADMRSVRAMRRELNDLQKKKDAPATETAAPAPTAPDTTAAAEASPQPPAEPSAPIDHARLEETAKARIRESVMKGLDPRKFAIHDISAAEWTGEKDAPIEKRTFTHPKAPGMVFTQEEVDALHLAAIKKSKEAQPAPTNKQEWLDSNLLTAGGKASGGHERPSSYKIDPEKYIGVVPKRIPEILGNARDQQFFGELLRAIDANKADALVRFHEGTMTQEDMDFLTYASYEYSKWLKEGEAVAAQITAEDIELMGRRNADMRNLIAFLPKGREVDAMKELTLHLAMRDPARLEDIRDAFKELKRARETGRFQRYEADIKAQCERLGIDPHDHGATFDLKNPERRKRTEARLAKHIHEQAGGFRRALDWMETVTHSPLSIPGSSYYKAILETREASRITPHRKSALSPRSWVLDTVNTRLNTITEYLGATVADPEVRRAVIREALTGQAQKAEGMEGPTTYAQLQELANKPKTQAELKEKIEARIAEVPNFTDLPQYQQDSYLSDIKSEEQQRQGRGRGFFAWLASALFGDQFNKAASAATGRTVHV
jgi:hypothetical protein